MRTLLTMALTASMITSLLAATTACSKAGMGGNVRTDISARMESASPTIAACYKAALREDRKLQGMMVVAFVAAPNTGAFGDVQVVRDDLRHAALANCVVEAVSGLKLATPQKTSVSVEYPLAFAPNQ
jgi:hypothetical protein